MPFGVRSTREVYDGVALPYLIVGSAVFVIVVLSLALLLVRYRARPGREAGDRATSPKLEVGYAVFLALVTAGLLAVTFTAVGRDDALGRPGAGPPLRVGVVAAQWAWRFSYSGTSVVQEPPARGQPTILYVPSGRRVLFTGRSQDVLHDFWIPDLRFQRQVWPAHTERWGLIFGRRGTYQGVCAWFCGLYHEAMRFEVHALAPARFDAWLAARRARGRA